MAKLFPSLDEIRNGRVKPQAGELYLLETLIKELDDTYEVYFNPLLNGDFPDIVVFRYGFGIYIIEVKDWNLNAYEYHIEKAYSNKTKKNFLRDYMYIKNKEQRILPPMNQVREYRKNIMEIYCFTYYQKLLFYKLESKFKQMPNPNTLIQTAVYFHSHDQSYIKNFFTLQSTDPDEQKLINSLPNRYVKLYGNNGVKNLINDIKKDTFINKIKNFKEIFDEVALLLRPSADFLEQRTAVSYDKLDKKQRELSNYQKGMIKKVKGKAGSGKTLTLANIAIKAFEDTQDIVLILCFNITLRNKIRDFISRQYGKSTKNSFLILHFHDFLKKIKNNHNIVISYEKDQDDEISADKYTEILLDKISQIENCEKFQTILIDEAQDFKENWFRVIKDKFLEQNGNFLLFADEKQNIYSRELDSEKMPKTNIKGRWNELGKSHRANYNLLSFAKSYQEYFLGGKYNLDFNDELKASKGHILAGGEIYVKENYSNDDLLNVFDNLRKNNVNHINDIAILGESIEALKKLDFELRNNFGLKTITTFETIEIEQKYKNAVLASFDKDKDIKSKLNDPLENKVARKHNDLEHEWLSIQDDIMRTKKFAFEANSGRVKISTIHSYKGWESTAVILVIDDWMNAELVYTGITRAKEILYILSNSTKFNEFAKIFKRDGDKILVDL